MNRLSELLPVGPPINEEQQIGRTGAIDSLEARLRSLCVVKMLEPRRVGKTSVARAALERIRSGGGAVAEVNLATRSDPEAVAKDLAVQLAGGTRRRLSDIASVLRRSEADRVTGMDLGAVNDVVVQAALGIASRDEAWQELL